MKYVLIAIFLLSQTLWAKDIPKDSFYQVQGVWLNQDAQNVVLSDFSGTPVIIAMVYTGCQYSCPLMVNKLLGIEKDLTKAGVKNYRFVLASFDSTETPKMFKDFMKKRKLQAPRWTFLSAKGDQEIRELAVVLGVNYQRIEGTKDFSHSNQINLLDESGRQLLQLKGISSDHQELVQKLVQNEKQP